MIDQDMCLGVFDRQTNRKAVRQASPMSGMKSPDEENRQPHGMIAYQAQVKEFSDEELAYWASYGITEDTLDRFQVRSLRSCHFTKADGQQYCIYSTALTPSYGYFFQEKGASRCIVLARRTVFFMQESCQVLISLDWTNFPAGEYALDYWR